MEDLSLMCSVSRADWTGMWFLEAGMVLVSPCCLEGCSAKDAQDSRSYSHMELLDKRNSMTLPSFAYSRTTRLAQGSEIYASLTSISMVNTRFSTAPCLMRIRQLRRECAVHPSSHIHYHVDTNIVRSNGRLRALPPSFPLPGLKPAHSGCCTLQILALTSTRPLPTPFTLITVEPTLVFYPTDPRSIHGAANVRGSLAKRDRWPNREALVKWLAGWKGAWREWDERALSSQVR
ncbi:hypothetical protein DFH29DRAFT_296435 [Suillus ampliporus]|nr:hypothetical protein DFH29DRAFT_296435 [Suillus ampliporus]